MSRPSLRAAAGSGRSPVDAVERSDRTLARTDPLTREVAEALARAARELPAGPVVERLRNYCGRVWDVLCSPAFTGAYGQALAAPPGSQTVAALGLLETCRAGLTRLLVEGTESGELRRQPPGPAARLVLSSLLARAHWCAHRDALDAKLVGTCTRVVAETLDLLLPALAPSPAGAPLPHNLPEGS